MKRIAVKYGLASGAIISAMTAIMLPLCMNGVIDFDKSEVVGYTTMVLSFVLVFFGVRSYRDTVGGGVITFGRALGVGLLVTLVACAVYVVGWEIVYWGFFPDFASRYGAAVVESMRAAGESATAIAATERQMAEFAELYRNPLFNVGVTFLEVFPVGLVVSLISAAILRRRAAPGAPVAAVA
jgi:hypothetical protein